MPPIFGEWLRVNHIETGRTLRTDNENHHQVFTKDGVWQYWYGSIPDTTQRKSFVVDAQKSPPTIDISMGGGPPNWRGIYKVEGDTLTLCVVTGNRDRPKTFESTADKPTTIWVFKRIKKD